MRLALMRVTQKHISHTYCPVCRGTGRLTNAVCIVCNGTRKRPRSTDSPICTRVTADGVYTDRGLQENEGSLFAKHVAGDPFLTLVSPSWKDDRYHLSYWRVDRAGVPKEPLDPVPFMDAIRGVFEPGFHLITDQDLAGFAYDGYPAITYLMYLVEKKTPVRVKWAGPIGHHFEFRLSVPTASGRRVRDE